MATVRPTLSPAGRSRRDRRRHHRQRRLWTRAVPVVAVAVLAFGVGIYESGASGRAERQLVRQYVSAWAHRDFRAMYALLDAASRRHLGFARFRSRLAQAASTATLTRLSAGRLGVRHGRVLTVWMTAETRLFGALREPLLVPLRGSGDSARVQWSGVLLFPGLRHGERLTRDSVLGARGSILASDGTPLAEGPNRSSAIPGVAGEIVGTLGPVPSDEAARYAALGYPPGAKVGLDGLERIFQSRLAGIVGGTLLAGRRALASVAPVGGETVRTTIVPSIEQAAIAALGGSFAGMTVMDPRTGALLALSGIAFSAVQPPGSTMKIITATAALQAHLTTLGTVYPVASSATIDGYTMQNSGGESCGGTLLDAFANSCNSVFAPLGAHVGAARFVAAAERFGFNHPVAGIPGAVEPTLPPAATIGSALDVGSSAIGQGRVQASTLEMADVGATIAMGGRRPVPTLLKGVAPQFVSVTSPHVASEVQQMMVAVVRFGTGTSAAISGVEVAGKTGTAELTDTATTAQSTGGVPANSPKNTDAWFVGYAPVGAPRVVACALFPAAGFGAQTAAPPVKQVLEAALSAHW